MTENEKYELEKNLKIERIQKKYKLLEEKKRNEITILYLCTSKELWCMDSFVDEIRKDNRYHFVVIIYPDPDSTIDEFENSYNNNKLFFYGKDIQIVDGYSNQKQIELTNISGDVLFFDQPGVLNMLEAYNNVEYLSEKFLICYVPYGYKIVDAGKFHYGLFFHNICWKIFCESEWHLRQFIKYGRLNGSNIVVTGLLKLDSYREEKCDYGKWKNKDRLKKRIIYAPHWTVNNPPFSYSVIYSTFEKFGEKMFEIAKDKRDYDWIFKPHPRLKYWAVESGYMTKKEITDYYRKWEDLENATVYDDGNYFDIFKSSDVLFTDCGSFLAEYLPTLKPIIHLYNSQSKYNENGQTIVDAYYRVECIDELVETFDRVVINSEDPLYKKRLSLVKKVMPFDINASMLIKSVIDKLMR